MKKLVFPKFKWNLDRTVNLFAILLSLGTLIVFMYQTRLIRQQQYASVTPYLILGTSYIGSNEMEVTLENKGIGPAIIEDMFIMHKDDKYEVSLINFLVNTAVIPDSLKKFTYSDVNPGLLISAGEEIILFKAIESKATGDFIHSALFDDETRIYIRYKSIYQEQWEIASNELGTTKID